MLRSLIRLLLPILFVLPLCHCALIPRPAPPAPPPASRLVTAEGTAQPDEAIQDEAPARPSPLQEVLADQVFQSHERQDLAVQFVYKRVALPDMPELEELQTLAAARVRCRQLMAEKIYRLPLERRRLLGPVAFDPAPELKSRLESIMMEQGRLEVHWNDGRTEVEGRYILPGRAVADAIRQYAQSSPGTTPSYTGQTRYREASPEQRQRLARERAIERARENLRQRLLLHPVRSNQTLDELIKRDPRMKARLDDFVRSAPLKSERVAPDGAVTVVIEADAGRLMDMLR